MDSEPKHRLKRFTVREFYPNANGGRFGEATPPYTDKVCVLASEADALIAAKDAEIAGLNRVLDQVRGIALHEELDIIVDVIDAARSKQEKRDE